MNASLKTITSNIKSIAAQSGKLDALAHQTVDLIIEHGQATKHYDKAAALVDVLGFNPRLQKEILTAFVGKIPHSIRQVNGSYKLSKRDESLLRSAEELNKQAEERKAKRDETTAKAAAKRAEQKTALAEAARVQADLVAAQSQLTSDKAAMAALHKEIAKLKKANTKLLAENEALKAELASLKASPEQAQQKQA